MGSAFVDCWKCDECGHRWIKGENYPTHCASGKCRKRSWDSKSGIKVYERKQDALPSPIIPKPAYPGPLSSVKMNPAMERFMAKQPPPFSDRMESTPERSICKYKEYDYES